MTAKVDKKKCKGCGACEHVCPVNAITLINGNVIITDDCVDCGLCAKECPNNAIL